jgi:hypothetical protein
MLEDIGDYGVVAVDTLQGTHGRYLFVEGPQPELRGRGREGQPKVGSCLAPFRI